MKTPVIRGNDTLPGQGGAPAADTAAAACGTGWPHESAQAQVSGQAQYIDDVTELRGTLHAAPVMSPVAHGRLLAIGTASQVQRDPAVISAYLGH